MNVKQVIAVLDDLGMNRGKIAAQAAHASMLFLLDGLHDRRSWTAAESLWLSGHIELSGRNYGGMKKVVVKVPDEASLRDLKARAEASGLTVKTVIDATLKCATCRAIGPDDEEKIDSVTDRWHCSNDRGAHSPQNKIPQPKLAATRRRSGRGSRGLLGWTDDAVASEPHLLNKLRGLRGPGASCSEVLLWLAVHSLLLRPPPRAQANRGRILVMRLKLRYDLFSRNFRTCPQMFVRTVVL
jgi:PTH2 family peptidyl-tRNA hydrolase